MKIEEEIKKVQKRTDELEDKGQPKPLCVLDIITSLAKIHSAERSGNQEEIDAAVNEYERRLKQTPDTPEEEKKAQQILELIKKYRKHSRSP